MSNSEVSQVWDAIVIGGGPAGLSAALMLGRSRRSVLVIDAQSPRNRFASQMHGVLGQEGESPERLNDKGRAEVADYGVPLIDCTVRSVIETSNGVHVRLGDGVAHEARTLIVASGLTDELPAIDGLAARWGKSVLHCPYCHGWEVADRRFGVIATSPASLHQTQILRQWSDRITLFSAAIGELDADIEATLRSRNVQIVQAEVVEILGEEKTGDEHRLSGIRTADGRTTPLDAIFVLGALKPHDSFLADLALERSELPFGIGSFLTVDQTGKTSHDRIWAVGNVVNPMANVPMSVGAGAFTGSAVNGALVELDFAAARAHSSSPEKS